MIHSFRSIRVAFLVGLALLALPGPGLQAQTRSPGMQPGMALPPRMMPPALSGQLPPSLMPSPFANPFGTGVLGGGFYGWNSRFGPSGYGGSGSYGPLYLPGYGGLYPGSAPNPAKPKEAKAAPRKEPSGDAKPAEPRAPDDPSRNGPSEDEVLSGKALNGLLDQLRRLSADGDSADRPNALLHLYVDGLRHINLTRGAGSIALLKTGGRLTWPAALLGPEFREPRERLTVRAPEAVRDATRQGRVDPATIRPMAADVGRLRDLLRQHVGALSFQQFSEARAFLRTFEDALVALEQPDAAHHFDGRYALRAQTVVGLVRQMAENGLRFAPALPGDEAMYLALHEILAAHTRAALGQAAGQ